MPIYEYRCRACGVRFEKLVFSMSAPPPACPSCQAEGVEKLMSVPAVQVSGGSSGSAGMGPCGQPKSSCGSGGFS